MSKMNYILPLALLVSGAATAATEATENPWYTGARLGGAHYSDFAENIWTPDNQDQNDLAGGIFLGYNYKPWLAVETGYTYLGEAQFGNNRSVEQQGIDLVGKFTWQATDSLDVFAKAGGFYYFADGKGEFNTSHDRGLIPTTGAGVEYFFNKNVSARLEYQYYHDIDLKDSGVDTSWNTHFYGVSLVYSWGAPAPITMTAMEPAVAEPQKTIDIEPLIIEIPFAFDSVKLAPKYIDQLKPIAQQLIKYPEAELIVIGHTDSTGPESYNQQLSERRAALVADYLATHFAIAKNRIKESGRGELAPKASNATKDGRALNRRVSVFTPGLTVVK
ncbi:OmpA/MotB domain protein [Psychromonas ingrahamii 37]|uniref:OmpA/MotB domain protein n=1 Tax=Psychromonas ingrahamii (strain DSM 17664 / CCUG 51855 / 37) TaxID=357804 RepID=A1SSS8_PSYIN|nr:OmpA family protein [Psychromonas ingrahamii]ABM02543.1 OmpA/MotB domain protein [Psychromonas ingrahamii 37]